jgi:hypothetical protein
VRRIADKAVLEACRGRGAVEVVAAHTACAGGLVRPVLAAATRCGVRDRERLGADVGGEGGKLVLVEVDDNSALGDRRHRAHKRVVAHVDDLEWGPNRLELAYHIEGAAEFVAGEAEGVEISECAVAGGDGAGELVVGKGDVLKSGAAFVEVWERASKVVEVEIKRDEPSEVFEHMEAASEVFAPVQQPC